MQDTLYFAPTGAEEALSLLSQYREKAVILAGGTDLVPKINYYETIPEVLVFLGNTGMDYIRQSQGGLSIGAATTTADIANDPLVAKSSAILAEAAWQTGCDATRNSATIGGNLANASPAADLATPLLALDADVVIKSASGERVLPIKDFFVDRCETTIKPGELLAEIRIPPVAGKTVFLKLGRRQAMTLSVVNVAARLEMNGSKCTAARIAIGSMAPTPLRCAKAEAMLEGKDVNEKLIADCAAQAISETSPIDDQRASAWYRRQAGTALVKQALNRLAGFES